MSAFPKPFVQEKQTPSVAQQIYQHTPPIVDTTDMTPLDDPQYLFDNAKCFQNLRELSTTSAKQKSKKNDEFQHTNQYLFGCYMPSYYSVLNFKLMEKFIVHLRCPNAPTSKLLLDHKEIIEHERTLFDQWLSSVWEENLRNRRLSVIPHVENYIKSACDFSSGFIKSHWNGTYSSKMKIDYNRENCEVMHTITMNYCNRKKISQVKHAADLPIVDVKNVESKISFTNDKYSAPQKSPFVQDELCQTLSKNHGIDVNICLSSLKSIMHLEKTNSLWLIPVNVDIDSDNRKTIYIGGAMSTGHFSQQEKCCYYLRKELKRKFIKDLSTTSVDNSNSSKYNYDKWTLDANKINSDVSKSFNILVRNKPHIQGTKRSNNDASERVLIPKVEYQPEFGFEKLSEEQLVEYWLDTYFRSPKTQLILVSVQYNMDIMMVRQKCIQNKIVIPEEKKQVYLQRLNLTIEKLTQLEKGLYVMLHNPKKPFQVDLYQSSMYGGFNLLNMYFVLQQTEVSDSLAWNPIDPDIICPIHEHFKVAPCMFMPNPVVLNIQMINEQVHKFKTILEKKETYEKEQEAKRKRYKLEKTKKKKKLRRENDVLFGLTRKKIL